MMRVSAKDAAGEIRAAILAMRRIPTDLRRDLNKNIRTTFNPIWQEEVGSRTSGGLDQAFLKGTRIKSGNPPAFVAASSKRKITKSGGGVIPLQHWPGLEYGSRGRVSTYTRTSPRGISHNVERTTTNHLRGRSKQGRVLGPSMTTLLPRLSSFFAQSVIRTFLDALDEGR